MLSLSATHNDDDNIFYILVNTHYYRESFKDAFVE